MAIVDSLVEVGAKVHLVLGPVSGIDVPGPVSLTRVVTASEMFLECQRLYPEMDGAIMAAAVSDFTPKTKEGQKRKRKDKSITLELEPTKDIAASLGQMKKGHQWLVGFALETTDELQNAKHKLSRKNLDMIVLNSLKDEGAGFGFDTNKVSLIFKNEQIKSFPLKPKSEVARDIVEAVAVLSTQ